MNKHYYRDFHQTIYSDILLNGLHIHLIPKQGYSGFCGALCVNFGSLNSKDIVIKGQNSIELKRGIAHFLEHRIFDNPKGQVFDLFSNNGASSNAYTSYDKTLYFFTCSNNIFDNVALLLDFTQELMITPEKVESEKGIIIEELKMYEDNPDFLLLKGILQNLYHNHEIKYDIGGEQGEIMTTSADLLLLAHQAYYHPKNMYLTISGDFQVEEMRDFIENNQKSRAFVALESLKIQKEEPLSVVYPENSIQFTLSASKCCYGIKLKPFNKKSSALTRMKKGIATDIILQLLFSKSSLCHEEFLQQKIITDDIGTLYEEGNGYRYVLVYADIYHKDKFIEKIASSLQSFVINETKLSSLKKQMIGHAIRNAENPSNLALEYGASISEGIDIFREIKIIHEIDLDYIEEIRRELCLASRSIFTVERSELND